MRKFFVAVLLVAAGCSQTTKTGVNERSCLGLAASGCLHGVLVEVTEELPPSNGHLLFDSWMVQGAVYSSDQY